MQGERIFLSTVFVLGISQLWGMSNISQAPVVSGTNIQNSCKIDSFWYTIPMFKTSNGNDLTLLDILWGRCYNKSTEVYSGTYTPSDIEKKTVFETSNEILLKKLLSQAE